MPVNDPTTSIDFDHPLIVGGLDWTWAYVIFRDIPGFPGYRAGTDGSFWSQHIRGGSGGLGSTWKRINPILQRDGYLQVGLRRDHVSHKRVAHRMILETFLGPCPPGKTEACHYPDRNRTNIRLSNLRWGTTIENFADREAHGMTARGSRHGKAKLTEAQVASVGEMLLRGMKQEEVASHLGISGKIINEIVKGKIWRHVTKDDVALAEYVAQYPSRRSSITASDIPVIRQRYAAGTSLRKIADEYGVKHSSIYSIVLRRTWGHVPD